MIRKCGEMIVQRFEEIADTQAGAKFLNELPFEQFLELIDHPELNVNEEIHVVKVIDRYLNHRRALPKSEEELEKDTRHLTEEEKKNREDIKAKRHAELLQREEEEKKALDQ